MMTTWSGGKLSSQKLKGFAVCALLAVSAQSTAAPSEQFNKLLSTLDELRSSQPSACGDAEKGMGGQRRSGLVPVER